MLKYELTKKQYSEIESLAFWVANSAYIRERYGNDEPELTRTSKTLELIFDLLDRLSVPFWVQNTVICFAENWRNYETIYLENFLKTKNITVA